MCDVKHIHSAACCMTHSCLSATIDTTVLLFARLKQEVEVKQHSLSLLKQRISGSESAQLADAVTATQGELGEAKEAAHTAQQKKADMLKAAKVSHSLQLHGLGRSLNAPCAILGFVSVNSARGSTLQLCFFRSFLHETEEDTRCSKCSWCLQTESVPSRPLCSTPLACHASCLANKLFHESHAGNCRISSTDTPNI